MVRTDSQIRSRVINTPAWVFTYPMFLFNQVRLSFSSIFYDLGTCGTAEDSITATSPFSTNAAAFPPTVCGTLTGEHSKTIFQLSVNSSQDKDSISCTEKPP